MTTITCKNNITKNYYFYSNFTNSRKNSNYCPGDGGETAGGNINSRCNDGGETAGSNVNSYR
jgi:hypothetical protein